MRRVVVRYSVGPNGGGPPQERDAFLGHAEFIERHTRAGRIVDAGPFTDDSGALIIFTGVTVEEATELVAGDPFVAEGVFVVEDVREWFDFVGGARS